MNTLFSQIHLRDIELNLHLGWPTAERINKQKVLLDVKLGFSEPPRACVTDELTDTYDYDSLIQTILKETESKEFRLIELMGAHIYQIIRKMLPDVDKVQVAIAKRPAISQLTGGVVFTFGDTM